jgi:hypothetical protein
MVWIAVGTGAVLAIGVVVVLLRRKPRRKDHGTISMNWLTQHRVSRDEER